MTAGRYQLHDEKFLLASLKDGDAKAFDAIYQRYARELFIKALHKVGSKEICEDIVQDVFTVLWTKREQLEVRQSLGAYLHGILAFKIIDHYRLACMHLKHIDQLIAILDQPDDSPVEKLSGKDQAAMLHTHIDGLSSKMRRIFLLSRFEGLASEEIAQKLHLSNQTVRNQISKALKILRARMSLLKFF